MYEYSNNSVVNNKMVVSGSNVKVLQYIPAYYQKHGSTMEYTLPFKSLKVFITLN